MESDDGNNNNKKKTLKEKIKMKMKSEKEGITMRTKILNKAHKISESKISKENSKTFGKLLTIIGAKYVYESKISEIIESEDLIDLWDKQRSINDDRVQDIIIYQKSLIITDFKGMIIFCEYEGNFYIIDGQHRIAAMILLFSEEKIDIKFITEVYHDQTKKDIQNLFIEINKAEPVPLFYLNSSESLDESVEYFIKKYKKAFKDQMRTIRPYITINQFEDSICELISQLNIKDSIELIGIIEKQNTSYHRNHSPRQILLRLGIKKSGEKILYSEYDEAKKMGFFLGLFRKNEWIVDILSNINQKDVNLLDFPI
jgi:hypothetical protein